MNLNVKIPVYCSSGSSFSQVTWGIFKGKNETVHGASKELKNELLEILVLLTFKQLNKIMGSCTVYKDKHVCSFL